MTKNQKGFRLDIWIVASLVILGLYLLFMLYPILRITAQSVLDGDTGAFSLRYFRQFFSDPYYFTTLLNSFKVALCATVTCLVLGVPLAYIYNATLS